ncbi:MAG: L-histidine N(alpha)-methyltransferase [Rhodospirillaceae bacterium]|jgi:dimethylhistidine N-methyltransferase|nr:L-histidine N(alpha)-methyltransferase [Rhodospirillaceae bacterium]|tara:strand:+ start:3033 stop:3998 length:966 start_codon:yes stop_codon:yes gene_type:complete
MDATVRVIDLPDRLKSFRDDVFEGLSREQKELPCKYFYDDRGSELFNTICGLDEYYPTRTETALLRAHGNEMADLIGPGVCLIEFGCGSLLKTRLLLDALRSPAAFVPIDISAGPLMLSAAALAADYPDLDVLPLVADFTRPVPLPDQVRKARENRIGFFPGSTIGNFDHAGAADFLATVADMVGGGGALLIGVDLKKDEDILVRAYDDAQGVTAAFNLNVLERINRELGGGFDTTAFRHRALYNGAEGRIEMHLVSMKDQTVTVHGRDFTFREGETIHTENSYKYHVEEFPRLAAGAGFRAARTWVDGDGLFSLHYLTLG